MNDTNAPLTHLNPTARDWRTEPVAEPAIDFHRSLPEYARTLLIELPGLAEESGVAKVLVKDESARLGLPAFKILGASFAIARTLSLRFGSAETLGLDDLRERLAADPESTAGLKLVAATDGNHGRAVAHIAALLGLPATIFVPPGLTEASTSAIRAEGAELIELDLPYDDVVTHAAEVAGGDTLLVQDTSAEGYQQIPQWIVDGYATLLTEVDDQLADADTNRLDLVVVPAGVGSLAQAVVRHYRSTRYAPAILVAEPDTAASVTTALRAGQTHQVPTADTVMTGLNCGTVSELAWPILSAGLDASTTVTDDQALAAVVELAALGVDAGPCGAATLAALRQVVGDDQLREFFNLDRDCVVVLLNTESRAANPKGPR